MLTSVSFNTDGWTLCLELAANSPIRIKPKNAARNAAVNMRDSNTEVHISGKAWTIRANIGGEIGRRASVDGRSRLHPSSNLDTTKSLVGSDQPRNLCLYPTADTYVAMVVGALDCKESHPINRQMSSGTAGWSVALENVCRRNRQKASHPVSYVLCVPGAMAACNSRVISASTTPLGVEARGLQFDLLEGPHNGTGTSGSGIKNQRFH